MLLAMAGDLSAQIMFQDKTAELGFEYRGRSYGSSWGDINGDGWYDIFMSCHYHVSEPYFTNDFPKLFVNANGESLSSDFYSFDTNEMADLHGAVFYDYDNDGDDDLLVTSGGFYHNLFFRNDGQSDFTDSSVEEGIDLLGGRGRQITCLDINNDGLTDLLFNNEQPNEGQLESQIRVKNFGSGYNLGSQFGWEEEHSEATQITDLDGDGSIDLLVTNRTSVKVLSRGDQEDFVEVLNMPLANVRDVECADFNNDLLPDIFIARGSVGATSIEMFNESTVHSTHRMPVTGSQTGFTFETTGGLSIRIYPLTNFNYTVHLGSAFVSPEFSMNDLDPIVLNPDAPVAQGYQTPDPDLPGVHVYIGEISDNNWKFEVVSNGFNGRISLDVAGNEPILNLITEGVPPVEENIANILLINQGDFNFVESDQPIFAALDNANSVTVGDYDNDGDIDLYTVVSNASVNSPNVVYENLGDGLFSIETDGWNTFGKVPGIGESATTGDINNDGFLDLFIANGASRHFLDSAKHVLYVNETANQNNWVMFDLQGDSSNSDGFGAKVYVTANGITQLREMAGGIHGICQDDPRLHFGLGSSDTIENVQVQWPSGLIDEYSDMEINQIHTLIEGDSPLGSTENDVLISGLYPNPSSDGRFILDLLGDDAYIIRVYDIRGQLLHSDKFFGNRYKGHFPDFPSGVYIIELTSLSLQSLQTISWVKN